MRKAIAVLMLVLVLGVFNIYSASNSDFSAAAAISADDASTSIDPAPNSDDDVLSISTNKGME